MGISQYFNNDFYDKNSPSPTIGSIFWTPTPEVIEVPYIFDVTRSSSDEHEITDFSFVELGAHHFRSKDTLPVKRLGLEDNVELMVFRGKKRPCVVLGAGTIPQNELDSINHPEQRRQGKHLAKLLYIVAPMYGCSTHQEKGGFGPVITSRIKALKYPHLCYFPPLNPQEAGQNPGSILRLDHVFATFLGRGTEPHELKVKDYVMDVVQNQFKVVCGMEPSDNFIEVKTLVEDCLTE